MDRFKGKLNEIIIRRLNLVYNVYLTWNSFYIITLGTMFGWWIWSFERSRCRR